VQRSRRARPGVEAFVRCVVIETNGPRLRVNVILAVAKSELRRWASGWTGRQVDSTPFAAPELFQVSERRERSARGESRSRGDEGLRPRRSSQAPPPTRG